MSRTRAASPSRIGRTQIPSGELIARTLRGPAPAGNERPGDRAAPAGTIGPRMSRQGLLPALMTACIAGLLLAHSLVPHVFAIGSIWESSLPWLVVLVPLIAIGALRRRNLASAVAALLLLLAWALLCLPGFTRHHAQA